MVFYVLCPKLVLVRPSLECCLLVAIHIFKYLRALRMYVIKLVVFGGLFILANGEPVLGRSRSFFCLGTTKAKMGDLVTIL